MKRRSKAEWLELFAAHEASSLTAAAFCRQHGLCPGYFSLRRRQLSGAKAVKPAPAFVPVVVSGGAEAAIELRLGCALTVRVPGAVSPHWLAELLSLLRA